MALDFITMDESKESLSSKDTAGHEAATETENQPSMYDVMALDIILEAAKLSRPLDVYDAPLLSKLMQDSVKRLADKSPPARHAVDMPHEERA